MTTTANLTGLISGDTFTVTFPPESQLGSWSGSLTSGGASISVTGTGGTIESVAFLNATDAEYNIKVAELQSAAQALDTAASLVETAISTAQASLGAYEKARSSAETDWYLDTLSEDLASEYFWEYLNAGDLAEARYFYKELVSDWKSLGPPVQMQTLETDWLHRMPDARSACSALKGQQEPILTAIAALSSTMTELGTTTSPVDTYAAQMQGLATSAKANQCSGELDAIVAKVEGDLAAATAKYQKVIKKAKSLGW